MSERYYYVETAGLSDLNRARKIKAMIEKRFGNYAEIRDDEGVRVI
jgi:hypothetical protein